MSHQSFYLSVSPSLFGVISTNLSRYRLAAPEIRIVLEKPFGHDLAWAGTPGYPRTGKKMRARRSEITVTLRDPPHMILARMEERRDKAPIIRLQPDEGIMLRTTIKRPGPDGICLAEVKPDMTLADAPGPHADVQDAYERLIMDVIRSDQTLFMRGDEVAWTWADPIIHGREAARLPPSTRAAGSSGPKDALMLPRRNGRRRREIEA